MLLFTQNYEKTFSLKKENLIWNAKEEKTKFEYN